MTAKCLEKYSLGVGDRFAHQARPQLAACIRAAREGATIIPVWNKSNREHKIVGSEPSGTRAAADQAVRELDWKCSYYLDADHINVETVDRFLAPCDFFTLDVADTIGSAPGAGVAEDFLRRHPELVGRIDVPGIPEPLEVTPAQAGAAAHKYLAAVAGAARIYSRIAAHKEPGQFVTEVSMDETDCPQTPPELLLILAAIADAGIPIQTIAPKFTGRFNKGVDYVGDVVQFEREFNEDLAVIAHAVLRYGLPENLKLSVHSGSDKFSIYPAIRAAVKKFNAGLHIKTAGTNWLEELIGLAEAGGDALALAKEIYCDALDHCAELCAPYATVIDIDPKKLPTKEQVAKWTSAQYCAALRHDPKCKEYNQHFRQLLHVGFKIAAKKGDRYLKMLEANEAIVGRNVTANLFERHLKPLVL